MRIPQDTNGIDLLRTGLRYNYLIRVAESNTEFIKWLYENNKIELNESNVELLQEDLSEWFVKWKDAVISMIKSSLAQFKTYASSQVSKYGYWLKENKSIILDSSRYPVKPENDIKDSPDYNTAISRLNTPIASSLNGLDLNRIEIDSENGNMWLKKMLIHSYNGEGEFDKYSKDYFYGADKKGNMPVNKVQELLEKAYQYCLNYNTIVKSFSVEANSIISFINKNPMTGEQDIQPPKSDAEKMMLQKQKAPGNGTASTNPYKNAPATVNKAPVNASYEMFMNEFFTEEEILEANMAVNKTNVAPQSNKAATPQQVEGSTTNKQPQTTTSNTNATDAGKTQQQNQAKLQPNGVPQQQTTSQDAIILKKKQIACNIVRDCFNGKASAAGALYRDFIYLLQAHVASYKEEKKPKK